MSPDTYDYLEFGNDDQLTRTFCAQRFRSPTVQLNMHRANPISSPQSEYMNNAVHNTYEPAKQNPVIFTSSSHTYNVLRSIFQPEIPFMKITTLFIFILLLMGAHSQAQDSSRVIAAVRTLLPVKIDGVLNDAVWKTAPVAENFVEHQPTFGRQESKENRTEVYIVYDDNAIYIGGFCHEANRDSISTELVGRDVIGINDFVGVIFDTYLDKINGFGYYVTPLNEQYDAKYTIGNEDGSWNSVYQSAAKITDGGWTFEMRIPYSAIRFSQEAHNWGFNIVRKRKKSGKQLMWNPVNPNHLGFLTQFGIWSGVKDIHPPLRLSFSPYFSSYLNRNAAGVLPTRWKPSVTGGMDVKYGINKAFTLDMTLIPDFGQVQSDNLVLNLSPFEVKYNENRTFFTEGTELFTKGNFFYSRRIGGQPIHYGDVYSRISADETILKNPSETRLVNATKISGRTADGLGIGFFNAVTSAQYATIEDRSKQNHTIQTSPLTNYNVLVFDQTLKHNSSVTLLNTSVLRNGHDYDANVTAAIWDLYDKQVKYNVWGKIANSRLVNYKGDNKTLSGLHYNLNFGKFKGPFNFQVYRYMADSKYQQNDMGYFTNNNYLEHGLYAGYRLLKPKSFYNNLYFNLNAKYSQRYAPRSYQSVSLNTNINGQLKNLWQAGVAIYIDPRQQDFYEPRLQNKMFKTPGSWKTGFWLYTNQAKKYSSGIELYQATSSAYRSAGTEASLNNQYRFNNKLTIGLTNYFEFVHHNAGYAFITGTGDSVIFGLRNRHTVENIMNIKYNFTNRMGITLRARHYWSKVDYTQFFTLSDDGSLKKTGAVNQNPDNNVNYFNIDLLYIWQFAQGSFINISWKNAADAYDQSVNYRYYQNLRNILGTSQQNNFSVKVIYYFDYISLKKRKAKQVR